LRNSGKPELQCNPSPSYKSMRRMMDARVKPAHDGSELVRIGIGQETIAKSGDSHTDRQPWA
jgi:hypothetical protein